MNNTSNKWWTQPAFIIAATILAVAAIGLNTAVSALQLRFRKEAVPLAKYGKLLDTIPVRVGDWVQVSKDEPLDKEIQDALATDQYIFRDYVNSTVVKDLSEFDGKSSKERKMLLGRLQAEHPEAVVNVAVTYYTGLVDTVAHIPERCYIADGYQPSRQPEVMTVDTGQKHLGEPATGPIALRFINFEDQTAAGRVTRQVAYCFFTNGHYESDPLGVRTTLQNLRYKHGFYSKIELMTVLKDRERAQKTMAAFLTAALPEIERCMPDWNSVEGLK